ncbi:MAG: tRNA pseudouridine(55) synthase TruB [Pseudomonadota bacterium]
MARKRKGNPVHGWLVVDKPLGVTSAAVVNKARWALRAEKAGHSGTLDPDATGCLAIAFGEATKVIPVAQEGLKIYHFTVRWGEATSTDDASGEVIATSPNRPSRDQIEAALGGFTGEIQQVPPKVSAVKIDGQRAYDVMRSGGDVALAARTLWVERLALTASSDLNHAEFELVCGKGGYVRSIARDLGATLGCFGHVRELRRLATGPFDLSQTVPFDAFDSYRSAGEVPALLPLERGLSELPVLPILPKNVEDLRHGRAIGVTMPDTERVWASEGGKAIAIGEIRDGLFRPARVILAH